MQARSQDQQSYDLGGKEPTITDANILLGRLNPDHLLGGKLKLNSALLGTAIKEKIRGQIRNG